MHKPAAPRHHIIITGTGRTGTTFLVRLCTELGLDTGFDRQNWRASYYEHCEAGLERDPGDADAPYIVKLPQLCDTLPDLLARGRIAIDHAIVPIRDIEQAALSRIRIGGQHGDTPGGLWKTANPADQAAVLALMFHRLVHTLVEHQIPHTFLLFPRLVQDPAYVAARLPFLFRDVPPQEFQAAFTRLADATKVHDFSPGVNPPAEASPALRYAAHQRRQRRARRIRRVTRALVVAAVIALPVWRVVLPHKAKGRSVPPAWAQPETERPPAPVRPFPIAAILGTPFPAPVLLREGIGAVVREDEVTRLHRRPPWYYATFAPTADQSGSGDAEPTH